MDTEVRILRSSSTMAMIGMCILSLTAEPRPRAQAFAARGRLKSL
jgi:hypothetical protein